MEDHIETDANENEVLEMATKHDEQNAEKHSENATDEAAKKVKKSASKRKGDKGSQDPMAASVKEDLAALVDGEATLSEDFKEKTAVLFEAAVQAKISEEIERLEESYEERLAEEVEETHAKMVDSVDSFLNHVVESWMDDNKVGIEQGIRTEIAENFIVGLKGLFDESYVDVPESKFDLVDELAEKVEELEASLNEEMEGAMRLAEANEELVREMVLLECSEGLVDTQAEKLAILAETVDFESAETFRDKVEIIKESHFSVATHDAVSIQEGVDEDLDEEVIVEETDPRMASILKALRG